MKNRILVGILLSCIILSACTSSVPNKSLDLMRDIKKGNVTPVKIEDLKKEDLNRSRNITDFSLDLFRESFEMENILISPLSIASALTMTANGAKDNTLSQMEKVLHSDIKELNDYLMGYRIYLPSDEKYKVSLANAIWFRDDERLKVNEDFLQINKDYFDAGVYKAPFDESTMNDMNAWVKDKTDSMIEDILKEAPPKDAVMYLVNALSFDAEWENIYEETQVYDGEFITESGDKKATKFMRSSEYSYLENDLATGFIKPYSDNKYAFVALLPNKGVTMKDFVDSLNAKTLAELMEDEKDYTVNAVTPKFTVEYEALLNDPLKNMGMTDAFSDHDANFSGLGISSRGNIFIGRVIHKTKISVDEKGTKAGAVTAVEMKDEAAMEIEYREVVLDRPFFYMIIDTEEKLPLFMGSLMDID
ncbi:MAG: serpin [Clostridiales bacterium]|nr:serpin [Clostridiales bacterium]